MLSMAVLSSGLRRASAMAGFTCDPPRGPVIFSSVAAFLLVEPSRAGGEREGISRYRAHPSGQSGSVGGRARFISFERAFEPSFLPSPLDIRCYLWQSFWEKSTSSNVCSIVSEISEFLGEEFPKEDGIGRNDELFWINFVRRILKLYWISIVDPESTIIILQLIQFIKITNISEKI